MSRCHLPSKPTLQLTPRAPSCVTGELRYRLPRPDVCDRISGTWRASPARPLGSVRWARSRLSTHGRTRRTSLQAHQRAAALAAHPCHPSCALLRQRADGYGAVVSSLAHAISHRLSIFARRRMLLEPASGFVVHLVAHLRRPLIRLPLARFGGGECAF